jgi:hypothetical protein
MPSNNTYFDCREELLLDLQERRAQLRHYAEDDDAATRFLEGPLDDPEWIVVVAPHDRRMLSTAQLSAGLRSGELRLEMLVWRSGMRAWSPIGAIAELNRVEAASLPTEQCSPPCVTPAAPEVITAALEPDTREPTFDLAPSTRVKQAVMGLSALIIFGVFLTMFAISSARDNMDQRARSRGAQPMTAEVQATPEEGLSSTATLFSENESN